MDYQHGSWLRPLAITLGIVAAWFVISVLVYQESPEDKPIIVSLLTGRK
ncbi:hypothetical protein [Bradyrhizobium zhanjiangense]|nr:hypothetical protein [Bradyrhizobium zhanjiangense]